MYRTNKKCLIDEEYDIKINLHVKKVTASSNLKVKLALNSFGSVKSLYVTKKFLYILAEWFTEFTNITSVFLAIYITVYTS